MTKKSNNFTMSVSFAVLKHLGRNLYRDSITVIAEAISNSWDADATKVEINYSKELNQLVIMDNGIGMNEKDFQKKFLKVGFEKRKDTGSNRSKLLRPFLGRKGVGKLALLSCTEKMTILTKTKEMNEFVGGEINKEKLNEIIEKEEEGTNQKGYPLLDIREELKQKYGPRFADSNTQGTIIHFDGIDKKIFPQNKNENANADSMRAKIALHFKFSFFDPNFKIFFNNKEITEKDLVKLHKKTQFVWYINEEKENVKNNYWDSKKNNYFDSIKKHETLKLPDPYYEKVHGYVGAVEKPKNLNLDENNRVTLCLYVNGRLREKDILKSIKIVQYSKEYFYGEIHFDDLDDENIDRFTTSREGVLAGDPVYSKFKESLKSLIIKIADKWDGYRAELKESGDPEKDSKSIKRQTTKIISIWLKKLKLRESQPNLAEQIDAASLVNVPGYINCFFAENLLRKKIQDSKITEEQWIKTNYPSSNQQEKKKKEMESRKTDTHSEITDDLSWDCFLNLEELLSALKNDLPEIKISHEDKKNYKILRNSVAHTRMLKQLGNKKLKSFSDSLYQKLEHIKIK